ncbi:MAG: hypothetical protein VR74_00125 [Hyphomonas sp. BRH_c22]|jgi:hypothetical protein|uniref:hypothetical protein n=1 Tax=unclassified Hyphomonas TaxID=2630699 RepID=UPI0005F0D11E|nr:hypothetical protein [Hyphomonas sp. BRH_c22]KJS39881.1 MAG: hypothetical protein VR74_00125 [Hyphomonas sp. BRH_c22]|tara:strand:- start:7475 stop:7891 length:417 start_codon:yes stop_codon:yes gene_type:complete
MSGYGPFDGFTIVAMALAVVLSALVSLIGTSARKRTISLGEARAEDLAEMTGILDPKHLLAEFGPPDMGRVWRTVTLFDVRRARQPQGWLMSSDLVDYGCAAIAVLALFVSHPLVQGALVFALCVQVGGWVVATRLPK